MRFYFRTTGPIFSSTGIGASTRITTENYSTNTQVGNKNNNITGSDRSEFASRRIFNCCWTKTNSHYIGSSSRAATQSNVVAKRPSTTIHSGF